MKNINLISKFDNLPIHGGMWRTSDEFGDWKDWRYLKIDGKWPYHAVRHVVEKFLGKSVDDAFSFFCSICPIQLQWHFYNDVDIYKYQSLVHRYGSYPFFMNDYYIDENKNICKYIKLKKKRHYVLVNSWEEEIIKRIYFHKSARGYGRRLPVKEEKYTITHYDKKLWEGSTKYIQYIKEEQEQRDANWRNNYDYTVYNLRRLKEEKRANDEDDRIRDSHGFDENSFKGIEYHGRARKRRKKKNLK